MIALIAALSAAIVLVIAAMFTAPQAQAAERTTRVRVPDVSPLYRLQVERDAARFFGLQSQPARLAAQVHQESGWNPRAQSPYAIGLTQFTPATAKWLPSVCPEVGAPDLWNPNWSISAQHCYMAWLFYRVQPLASGRALNDCDRWAFALRAYNGGEGWLLRERRAAAKAGAQANAWREVEGFRSRAGWAHKENTEYPQRILLRIEPAYLAAGWPGGPACS
ncbi:MAG: transglycosylase SLT domain-containing protein [Lysobacteraceae bacterium]